jgi:hypothetical protein
MKEYKPNELIIDKACSLWVGMLSNPRFDALGRNGSDDPHGSMAKAQMLATVLAAEKKANFEQLQAFSKNLKSYLMNKIKIDFEHNNVFVAEDGYYHSYLTVDYHPDLILYKAAEEAGIGEHLFPWKTRMEIHNSCLSLSYGYGTEYVYYYPCNDKWLVTTLCGSDISKVIEYMKGGHPSFVLEE